MNRASRLGLKAAGKTPSKFAPITIPGTHQFQHSSSIGTLNFPGPGNFGRLTSKPKWGKRTSKRLLKEANKQGGVLTPHLVGKFMAEGYSQRQILNRASRLGLKERNRQNVGSKMKRDDEMLSKHELDGEDDEGDDEDEDDDYDEDDDDEDEEIPDDEPEDEDDDDDEDDEDNRRRHPQTRSHHHTQSHSNGSHQHAHFDHTSFSHHQPHHHLSSIHGVDLASTVANITDPETIASLTAANFYTNGEMQLGDGSHSD